jgi:hypothetical protein
MAGSFAGSGKIATIPLPSGNQQAISKFVLLLLVLVLVLEKTARIRDPHRPDRWSNPSLNSLPFSPITVLFARGFGFILRDIRIEPLNELSNFAKNARA